MQLCNRLVVRLLSPKKENGGYSFGKTDWSKRNFLPLDFGILFVLHKEHKKDK